MTTTTLTLNPDNEGVPRSILAARSVRAKSSQHRYEQAAQAEAEQLRAILRARRN